MNFSHFYEKYNLSEFVAFPKGEETIILGGKKYYKSKSLNEKVKVIIKQYADPDVSDILVKCVDKDIVIPVFVDKNIPQYIINMIREKYRRHPKGSASLTKGYVFINPRLFHVDDQMVFQVLIHELMHLAEHQHGSQFYSINMPIIMKFYKVLFSELFEIKSPACMQNKDISEFIQLIRKDITQINLEIYNNLFIKIKKCSSLSKQEYDKKSVEIINFINMTWKRDFNKISGFEFITDAASKAYLTIGGGCAICRFFQEFWSASEIIGSMATINPNNENIKKTIKLFK